MTITLNAAQAMIERARAHAASIDVPMNIAVTDGGAHLLAFARMDGAILGSIEIALAKAKTSILFNAPSENLWDFCKPGGPAPATEYTNGGLIPYAGGVALNDHRLHRPHRRHDLPLARRRRELQPRGRHRRPDQTPADVSAAFSRRGRASAFGS
jgi:uncharacterized protein GlcG (DUF336 family)